METVNIRSVTKDKGNQGRDYLKLVLDDNSALFVFDTKLFGALEQSAGGVAKLDIDRNRQYPKVIAVHSVEHGMSSNGASGVSDKETRIMREVALKAAIEAAGLCADTSADGLRIYLATVRALADGLLDWLESPMPF